MISVINDAPHTRSSELLSLLKRTNWPNSTLDKIQIPIMDSAICQSNTRKVKSTLNNEAAIIPAPLKVP